LGARCEANSRRSISLFGFKFLEKDPNQKSWLKQMQSSLDDLVLPRNADEPVVPRKDGWIIRAQRSVFKDFSQISRQRDGKFFRSEQTLIPTAQAQPFPSVGLIKALDGQSMPFDSHLKGNQASLVVVSSKRVFAAPMIQTWRNALEEIQKDEPDIKLLELVVVTNLGFKAFGWALKGYDTKTVPTEERSEVFYWSPKRKDNFDSLRLENDYVPYVYLVSKGLIRWRAVGIALPQEVDTLKSLIHSLNSDKKLKP